MEVKYKVKDKVNTSRFNYIAQPMLAEIPLVVLALFKVALIMYLSVLFKWLKPIRKINTKSLKYLSVKYLILAHLFPP